MTHLYFLLKVQRHLLQKRQQGQPGKPDNEMNIISHLLEHMSQVQGLSKELRESAEILCGFSQLTEHSTPHQKGAYLNLTHSTDCLEQKLKSQAEKMARTIKEYGEWEERAKKVDEISNSSAMSWQSRLRVGFYFEDDHEKEVDFACQVNLSILKGYLRKTVPTLRSAEFDLGVFGELILYRIFFPPSQSIEILFSSSDDLDYELTLSSEHDWGVVLRDHFLSTERVLWLFTRINTTRSKEIDDSLTKVRAQLVKAMKQQRQSTAALQRAVEEQQSTTDVTQQAAKVLLVQNILLFFLTCIASLIGGRHLQLQVYKNQRQQFLHWVEKIRQSCLQVLQEFHTKKTSEPERSTIITFVKHLGKIEELFNEVRESVLLLVGINQTQKEAAAELDAGRQVLVRAIQLLRLEHQSLEARNKDRIEIMEKEVAEWENYAEKNAELTPSNSAQTQTSESAMKTMATKVILIGCAKISCFELRKFSNELDRVS